MKTAQKLVWLDGIDTKTFLLMAHEATEFLELAETHGTKFAFERLTGYNADNAALITLEIKYHFI